MGESAKHRDGVCKGLVQGLRISKVSRLFVFGRTQPPQTRRPCRGCGLPCRPWQGIAVGCGDT